MKRSGPWASRRGRPAWLLCAVVVLGASGVGADEPSTESRVTACAGIPEGVARLACYDRLASEIFGRAKPIPSTPAVAAPAAPVVSTAQTGAAQAGATAPAPTVPAPRAPAAAATAAAATGTAPTGAVASVTTATGATPSGAAQATFGLTARALTPAADSSIRYITARVTHLRSLAAGGFMMELDNGQTWEQVESTDLHLQEGDSVKISRAALGSFWLATPSHRGSRVKRVR